jgi:ABC-type multidrug transport system ATPase subunit
MLSIRALTKVYPGPVAALQGIDLDVGIGMFGLLGPNGAGKSTLMKIVAGLLEPSSGSVRLDDLDVIARPQEVRARLGYLPQEFGFYPHLTGEEMLEHLLRLKGASSPGGTRALARALLERVNLGFAAKRRVKSYSGGMRQRLGIAQAIAGDPRLLVVDEPTAGLDPEERMRFYRVLAELAAERIVLLSTHIVEDVAVLCPQFAVIRGGKLLARTSPAEARAALVDSTFEGLIDEAELARVRQRTCVTSALLYDGRQRVRVYQPDGDPPAGFAPATPTLEDAYFVLMQSRAALALGAEVGAASTRDGAAIGA